MAGQEAVRQAHKEQAEQDEPMAKMHREAICRMVPVQKERWLHDFAKRTQRRNV